MVEANITSSKISSIVRNKIQRQHFRYRKITPEDKQLMRSPIQK
jgi:hypothetical protein